MESKTRNAHFFSYKMSVDGIKTLRFEIRIAECGKIRQGHRLDAVAWHAVPWHVMLLCRRRYRLASDIPRGVVSI